ncbi:hypothetical protein C1H46_028832 [Malus baccata]|uniref:Uncharacterized protein n=1 Tax=Malus baccata TaxID=106549 RepID=A0A540LGP8_MALBA|nr:hypothetical protein C1H46_028832 [Malus baccata]
MSRGRPSATPHWNFVMENVRVEIESRLILSLDIATEIGCRFDLQDVLERFVFNNVSKLAFNVDPNCLRSGYGKFKFVDFDSNPDHFMQAFEEAATLNSARFMYAFQFMLKVKKIFNVGSERRLKESISTVHNFADGIIKSRISDERSEDHHDLLSLFIGIPKKQPIIEFSPRYRDKHHYRRSGHDIISFDMLYPPVPIDSKVCLNDDVWLNGTVMGKGWLVTYHAYTMRHMEMIWGNNYREYLPKRWLMEDDTCRQESVFRYSIFHARLRMCLGKDLAYI